MKKLSKETFTGILLVVLVVTLIGCSVFLTFWGGLGELVLSGLAVTLGWFGHEWYEEKIKKVE
jgi:hypothetical protein